MAKKRTGVTRREFLQQAALASGAMALTGLAPAARAGRPGGRAEARRPAHRQARRAEPDPGSGQVSQEVRRGPGAGRAGQGRQAPPVEKRIPEEPMVVKPLHAIGKYGGTWRRGFTGPGDGENGNRIVSTDKILFWDYTGTKIVPSVAKDWKMSADGKVDHHLPAQGHEVVGRRSPSRRTISSSGTRTSTPTRRSCRRPIPDFMVNGKPGVMTRSTRPRSSSSSPSPYFLFVDILAGDTLIGGGQATPAAQRPHHRRLYAGPLPEAVPAEVLLGRTSWTRRPRRRASTTG